MNRLTKDLNTPHDDTTYSDIVKDCVDRENIVLTKLKHFEDIEDELDFDLLTLILALKNGIYAKVKNTQEICQISEIITLGEKSLILPSDFRRIGIEVDLDYKNYGKTWALTKE